MSVTTPWTDIFLIITHVCGLLNLFLLAKGLQGTCNISHHLCDDYEQWNKQKPSAKGFTICYPALYTLLMFLL